jgi:transposase
VTGIPTATVAELDQDYIQKMEDVLAVYEKPYTPAEPVVCVDEKPVSLHADVRPPRPAKPGKPAKQDNEYERRGTANLFGAVEPKTGRHFTTATPDRSGCEFARLVDRIVDQYPDAQTIHLVMDNLNIHGRKSLVNYFGEEQGGSVWDRLTVHYTPKHGSWLNQAEIELSLVSRQCLGTRRMPELGTLQREVKAWNRRANRERIKINWRFTRKKARKLFHYKKPRASG